MKIYDDGFAPRKPNQSVALKIHETAKPLHEIARLIDGYLNGDWINIRAPSHGSGDRSLGFKFDKNAPDGFRVHSFAGDSPDKCREFVRTRLSTVSDVGSLVVEVGAQFERNAEQTTRIARALALWDQAQAPEGSVVEKYLNTRCCPLPALAGAVLRFHPDCPFGAYRLPAMVALIRNVISHEPCGIHRTALCSDGSGKRQMPNNIKAKMILGRAKGAAVMLDHAAEFMGIGEGIETSISAQRTFGLPVWAALSAGGITGFPVLPDIEHLTIFADHDSAGKKAAMRCGERYRKAGIPAAVRFPSDPNTDWNDHLRGEQR